MHLFPFKRILPFISMVFLFASFTARAQDVITQNNGDEIKAKVLEVGTTEIKYKKSDNLGGPTYSLFKSDVFMIRYQNGTKDLFGHGTDPVVQKDQVVQKKPMTKYDSIVANADENFKSGNFTGAKVLYTSALVLKPTAVFLKDQVTACNTALESQRVVRAKYDSIVTLADLAYKNRNFFSAQNLYTTASILKPDLQYPKDQLVLTDREMAMQNRINARYDSVVNIADHAFKKKRFIMAHALYLSAQQIKPDAEHPKNQVLAIDKEMLEQSQQVAPVVVVQPANPNPDSKRLKSFKSTTLFGKLYTLSNVGKKDYLAIGAITDVKTGLSRSFALWAILKKTVILKKKPGSKTDTLVPVLTDYPLDAAYGITGHFEGDSAKFKMYKHGKEFAKFTLKNDWGLIYKKIRSYLEPDGYTSYAYTSDDLEGKRYSIPSDIGQLLPGKAVSEIEPSSLMDSLVKIDSHLNVKYTSSYRPYNHIMEVYGGYSKEDQGHIFFFSSSDVPSQMQYQVKSLVFPLSKWITPSLSYLTCGYQLISFGYLTKAEKDIMAAKKYDVAQFDFSAPENCNDLGAAQNAFYAALRSSNSIHCGPAEKALIRATAFDQISKSDLLISNKRIYMSAFHKLGSDLNNAYLASSTASSNSSDYYSSIQTIADNCSSTEQKARAIRGQRRAGYLQAGLQAATAISSAASGAPAASSQVYIDQMAATMDQTATQSDAADQSLNEEVESQGAINAGDFITEGTLEDIGGRTYVAEEVSYHLNKHPEIVREVLMEFAVDMPQLKKLLDAFYSNTNAHSRVVLINEIFSFIGTTENEVIAREAKELKMTYKLKLQFF